MGNFLYSKHPPHSSAFICIGGGSSLCLTEKSYISGRVIAVLGKLRQEDCKNKANMHYYMGEGTKGWRVPYFNNWAVTDLETNHSHLQRHLQLTPNTLNDQRQHCEIYSLRY